MGQESTPLKLRVKLLLRSIPVLLILLVAMAVVALVTLNIYTKTWTDKIQTHVLDAEKSHIIELANNVALFTQRRFKRMSSDMEVQRQYATQLLNDQLVHANDYTVYHITSTANINPKTDASVWWNKNNNVAGSETYLGNTSSMNNIWRAFGLDTSSTTGLYQAQYIGIESTGLYHVFPFQRNTGLGSLSYYCYDTSSVTTGYNPRCRHWYYLAKQNTTAIAYTPPYVDALGGSTLITASAAVSSLDGATLLGVVGLDIDFASLERFYTQNKLLDNGFPFLVDNSTGALVVYPGLKRTRSFFMSELHFTDAGASAAEAIAFETAFNTSVGEAKATYGNVQFTYTRLGQTWYGSVRTVNDTNFVIGAVVPQSDIEKPTNDVKDRVQTALTAALVVAVIIISVMIAISIVLNWGFAENVTNTIYALSAVTVRFASGDYSEKVEDKEEEFKELHQIRSRFREMALAVRFSNPEVFKNDLPGALDTCLAVENVLARRKNTKALGIVRNNVALHVHSLDSSKKYSDVTTGYLKQSIKDQETCVAQATSSFSGGGGADANLAQLPTTTPPYDAKKSSQPAVSAIDVDGGDEQEMEETGKIQKRSKLTAQDVAKLREQLNSRLLNLACVNYGDANFENDFKKVIDDAKKSGDPTAVVTAYIRFGEALDAKKRIGEADACRAKALDEAMQGLEAALAAGDSSSSFSGNRQQLQACIMSVGLACEASIIIRKHQTFQTRIADIHHFCNLHVLVTNFSELQGLNPPHGSQFALRLLAYCFDAEGATAIADSIRAQWNINTVDRKKQDTEPEEPHGPQVAVENLASGSAQTVSAYNEDAIKGNFGENVQYDQFGNPIGDFELAKDGAMVGYNVLIYLGYTDEGFGQDVPNLAKRDLEKKGFHVDIEKDLRRFCSRLNPDNYDVAWIISGWQKKPHHALSNLQQVCKAFHAAGRGLFIMADNDPFFQEANGILPGMFNFVVTGNTQGGKVLHSGNPKQAGYYDKTHLLFTGLNASTSTIHEGYTICYPSPGDNMPAFMPPGWNLLATSSDNNPAFICRDTSDVLQGEGRVAVDVGHTKLLARFYKANGNNRYLCNVTTWLAMLERPRLSPEGRKACERSRHQLTNGPNVGPDGSEQLPTLKEQMIKMFGTAYSVLVLIVFLVLIIVSMVTINNVETDLRAALQSQVERQAKSVMSGAEKSFSEDLVLAANSFVKPTAYALGDMLRSTPTYSLASRTSYYDLGTTTTADFKSPLVTLFNIVSSIEASSFYVPYWTSNAASLNASVQSVADKTSNVDPIMSPLYKEHQGKFFNLAAGLNSASYFSTYRRIPAIDTSQAGRDPNRQYNPTTRGWYTSAASASSYIVTQAYRDFLTSKWMITVANKITDPSSSTTIRGVASADILLSQLISMIDDLRVLKNGRVIVVSQNSADANDGYVLASQEFLAQDSVVNLLKLSDLTLPKISSDMRSFIMSTQIVAESSTTRNQIFSTNFASGSDTATQGVMVIPTRISGFSDGTNTNPFYFVALVKEKEVFGSFQSILGQIESVRGIVAGVLVAIFVVALILAWVAVFSSASLVSEPIEDINNNTSMLIDNIGSSDLTTGLKEIRTDNYLAAYELAFNFNAMVNALHTEGETASPKSVGHARKAKLLMPAQDGALYPKAVQSHPALARLQKAQDSVSGGDDATGGGGGAGGIFSASASVALVPPDATAASAAAGGGNVLAVDNTATVISATAAAGVVAHNNNNATSGSGGGHVDASTI